MPLIEKTAKTLDPRTGHTLTTRHTVNTSSPPHTVYLDAARRRPDFDLDLTKLAHCDRCGRPLGLGSWPFCPH